MIRSIAPEPPAMPHDTPPDLATLTAPGRATSSSVPVSAPALPAGASVGRYELGPEIARGGMGVVYAATDADFGREVAVKVLRPDLPDPAGAAERFRFEAKITGRLDHFGVVPSHALGTLPDGRPFLVMKLIRGRTLADLLRERPDAAHDLPRFVRVFEQICQTVAYAHSRRILHRDLKPANVMLGGFGEAQVMDWGLAKEIGGAAAAADPAVSGADGVAPGDDPTDSCRTRAGDVLGTPAYMPPEQARGEVDRLCPRADVFALGAILCEILTGTRPYGDGSGEVILARAAAGDTAAGVAALGWCHADRELIDLARACMAADPAARPADAGALAAAVTAHRAGVEARLRTAEIERAARAVKVRERQKRRRVKYVLAGAVAVILLGLGVAVVDVRFRDAKARAFVTLALKSADDLRTRHRVVEAAEVLDAAADRLTEGVAADLEPVVASAKSDLAFARKLDDIRMRKSVWLPAEKRFNTAAAPPAYRAAFAANGLDVTAGDPAAVGDRVAASRVRQEIVDALDDWSVDEPYPQVAARLLAVARRADPGEWRDRFRDPANRADPAALRQLARSVDLTARSAVAIVALGELMQRQGVDPSGVMVGALNRNPTDFHLAFALGQWYVTRDPAQAVDHYRTARALRPDHAVVLANLGVVLAASGDRDGAEVAYKEAAARDPVAFGHLLTTPPAGRTPVAPPGR